MSETVAVAVQPTLAELVQKAREYLRAHLEPLGPSKSDTIHQLVELLLDDHQRIHPHHADMCPLCMAASVALAAPQLPVLAMKGGAA